MTRRARLKVEREQARQARLERTERARRRIRLGLGAVR